MAIVGCFVVASSLVGLGPLAGLCGRLSAAFTAAAIVTMIGALVRREPPGRGSLNGWDESVAFNGAAIIAQMMQGLHA